MLSRITTVAFKGIEAVPVDVQVQVSNGLPAFNIVGLANKTVAESRERIRSALTSLGLSLPPKRITVNLSPADMQKEGSHFDLPIAIALLTGLMGLPEEVADRYIAVGELSLAGDLLPINGVLAAAFLAASLGKKIICPFENAAEAGWGGQQGVLGPKSLAQLIQALQGKAELELPMPYVAKANEEIADLRIVRGQKIARRALEISAAGGHNLLMIGAPGAGKSLLASCLPGILPDLSPESALEVSTIHSVAGVLNKGGLIQTPPFRAPHHSASMPSLVGGGAKANPGEVSLAHRGVLFLDELPEFQRSTLEALRQPIESGSITVSRANAHITYPACIQLIAAMNPCRCGYASIPEKACSKLPKCAIEYQEKISGPLLDRIDLQVEMSAVNLDDLRSDHTIESESSSKVRSRVIAARRFQELRNKELLGKSKLNSALQQKDLEMVCKIDNSTESFFFEAAKSINLSARGLFRTLKVARTIADLAQRPNIVKSDISEALSYRFV